MRARYGPALLRWMEESGELDDVTKLPWELFYAVDDFNYKIVAMLKSGKIDEVMARSLAPGTTPVAVHIWDHFGVGHAPTSKDGP
jgi:hypothetical protein